MSRNKAITLLDLLIGIFIFSLIAMIVSIINLFSQREVRLSVKNAQCQKEAVYVLEYILKDIYGGIGDFSNPAVVSTTVNSNSAIIIRKDSNQNGRIESVETDRQSAFVYCADEYEMRYYPDVAHQDMEVISRKVFMSSFDPVIKENYVTVEISACWDPRKEKVRVDCGSQENPLVTIKSRVAMPLTSTH